MLIFMRALLQFFQLYLKDLDMVSNLVFKAFFQLLLTLTNIFLCLFVKESHLSTSFKQFSLSLIRKLLQVRNFSVQALYGLILRPSHLPQSFLACLELLVKQGKLELQESLSFLELNKLFLV